MRAVSILLAAITLLFFGFCREGGAAVPATLATTSPTTLPANAATGTWHYVIHIEDMDISATADLTQTDTKVTGTVKAGVDEKGLEITDGKITGNDISFILDRKGETGTLESKYTGKLDGDKIKGRIEIYWLNLDERKDNVEWSATRVKMKAEAE